MKFGVRYEDNILCDGSVEYYNTEQEAEASIDEELENVKEYLQSLGYDYGDFGTKTEIWVPGGNEYASWERLWI